MTGDLSWLSCWWNWCLFFQPVYRRAYLKATRIGLCRASELSIVTECDEKTRKSANKDLGKKAIERWECILHYLALPSQKSEQGVSGTTKMLFRSAGLTSSENGQFFFSLFIEFLVRNCAGIRIRTCWTILLD